MDDFDERLTEFALDVQQDVIARTDASEDGALRAEVFTEVMFERLADAGAIDEGIPATFEGRGMRCSGFHIPEDRDRLDLFLSVPRLDGTVCTIPRSEIEAAFRRLKTFLTSALEGLHKNLEEASDAYDMARSIWQARSDLLQARLFVITDAVANIERLDDDAVGEIEISHQLWDLRRFLRAEGTGPEPVHIDFPALREGPLRGIVMTPKNAAYRCILTALPGDLLVDIYARFGPRLLERNVRSFLQLKGKVNQGIRKTILEEPENFLAFNNGLSVTTSGLTLREHGDGTADLLEARDFQIVNGGQTTGSIFRAARKDKADVSLIVVPVKITEILDGGDVEEIAPRISQSANTQNKIAMADFSSNHSFHRSIQELSRSTWAPPPADGMQKQTQWFYERARGQYHDALALGTPAARKAYEALHPRRQVIQKTDLAKFEITWQQAPYIVSRGAQKCYLHFMDVLDALGPFVPDEPYFHRIVARAILFRSTEKIVSGFKFGGYRANIVTYTLSWLSHHTAKRVDLEAIWKRQTLAPSLAEAISLIAPRAHEHITDPPGGQNITEWCKKEGCWEKFREVKIALPDDLESELLADASTAGEVIAPAKQGLSDEDRTLIDEIAAVSADTWFGISKWAKETQTLQPWQRRIAYSLGTRASRGIDPSIKQATQGRRILEEARSLGFSANLRDDQGFANTGSGS